MRKNNPRLWQFINGEPYLVDGEIDTSWKGTWFFPKIVEKDRIILSNPPMPLTVGSLRVLAKSGECVTTGEVAEVCRCSRLTIIRHVAAGHLKPKTRMKQRKGSKSRNPTEGKGFLFSAGEVLRWMKTNPIAVG